VTTRSNHDNEPSGLPATVGDAERHGADNADAQFITFKIGNEEYGVDILAVREIIAWADVTQLPNTRNYVRGVLNLRGSILPVFDLRCRFGMGLTKVTKTHVIIIVHVHEKLIGILADSVSKILVVDSSEIRPMPEVDLVVDQEFLAGLANAEDRMVAILNAEHLFDLESLHDSIEGGRTVAARDNSKGS